MRELKWILILVIFPGSSLFSQELYSTINFVDNESIVAEVGGKKITAEEFFYSYEFGPAFVKKKKDSKKTHLKYMIYEKLIAMKGYENEIFKDEEVSSLYNDIEADLATEAMFKDEILNTIEISELEIDTLMKSKQIELELRWLFADSFEGIKNYLKALKKGVSFDSLFNTQINDTVTLDMRKMKTTLYSLRKNNPLLAGIIDTLKAGSYSAPIHVENQWYVVKLENVWTNVFTTETEYNKLKYEAREALLKIKMDQKSNQFVDNLLKKENPVIKRNAFDLLTAYLGKFVLPKEKYDEWELDGKLETVLKKMDLKRGDNYPGIILVKGKRLSFFLDEFIKWYRNRSLYIKINKDNLLSFSRSLEGLIWRMVRDKMLTNRAGTKGYFENKWVRLQSGWWRDKIAFSAMRKKLEKSILLENNEFSYETKNNGNNRKQSEELTKKMLRTISEAKKEFKVVVNYNLLEKVRVSESGNKKAIDFYFVKKGGLIPRPAYPTIDAGWASWE